MENSEANLKGSLSENGKMFNPLGIEDARETYLALLSTCTPEEQERYKRMFKQAYGEDLV